MKLITRDTDYAVRALCYIAKNNKRVVPVTELTQELKTPRPFLRKLLQHLNKKGVVISYKGKSGGFKLLKPAKNIFLTDIIGIFQGEFKLNECFLKKEVCPNRKECFLRKKVKSIETYVLAELKRITIESLLKQRGTA